MSVWCHLSLNSALTGDTEIEVLYLHVTPRLKWAVHVPKYKWTHVCMYVLAQHTLSGCCFDTDLRKRYRGSDWQPLGVDPMEASHTIFPAENYA
jgi:hypothetical protein